jgi:hypothetical protein
MLSTAEARELIDDLFEEEALALGGLVALHGVDDQLVWRLVRNMDALRGKALRWLEEKAPRAPGRASPEERRPTPHPAIEEFLRKLRGE